jgi:hypothetical protein
VNYYATPSESLAMGWQCKMYANDSSSASTSNATNFTIASLIAIVLNVTTVDFGSISPNANNTADVPFNVTNFGNVIIDAKFAANNLSDGTPPDINASNLWYNITFGTSGLFKAVQNSSSGPSGVDNIASYNLNVSYSGMQGSVMADINQSNKTQYFRIHIDTGQPTGTYTGILYVTGTANA